MGRTVLVADDSPSIQNKAKGILTGEGLEVVTVSNGVAAIKKLPSVKPLLVLADVAMPGRDGYEVCEFVKNSPELSHVPVVLVFSDGDPYDEQRGARACADATIKKSPGERDPFDHEELISTVARFLAQAEATAPREAPPPAPAEEPEAPPPEPMDEVPELPKREESPELEGLEEGVAFGAPAFEEIPTPTPERTPEYGGDEGGAGPAEAPPEGDEEPIYAEPVLIEDTEPVAPEPGEPAPERTMVFRAPVEISEPVLSDELAPEEVSQEAAPPPAQPEAATVDATSLDSYSLTEASEGQVRFAPGEEAGTVAEGESESAGEEEALTPSSEPAPEQAPPPPSPTLDADQVYSIVHKVVVKMSPPAFPAQAIEEMARRFTDEIVAEQD